MCIIAIKTGSGQLTEQHWTWLETCFKNNDDGAGFSYPVDGSIHIEKGFMSWISLKQAITDHDLASKKQVLFHFRWATHGDTSPENCHPFPLSSDERELTSVSATTDVAVAHNGILFEAYIPGSKLSDSQLFLRDYLSGFPRDVITTDAFMNLLSLLSKFAVMTVEATYIAGRFYEELGWFFSNESYKQNVYKPATVYPRTPVKSTSRNDDVYYPDICDFCGAEACYESAYLDSLFCNQCSLWYDAADLVPLVRARADDDDEFMIEGTVNYRSKDGRYLYLDTEEDGISAVVIEPDTHILGTLGKGERVYAWGTTSGRGYRATNVITQEALNSEALLEV